MEPTHHDPRLKQTIKGVIYDQLYLPAQKQMTARLESLVQRNTLLGGFTHPSFYYKEVVYRIDDSPLPRLRNKLIKQFDQTRKMMQMMTGNKMAQMMSRMKGMPGMPKMPGM